MNVVYISSPYSCGNPVANVSVQIHAMHRIMDMKAAPIAPLLTHFADLYRPRPYDDWLHVDLAIIPKMDVVLRLPGISPGADREVAEAMRCGVPVCYSFEMLANWLKDNP